VRPFGERWRAPYACDPWGSRGRLCPEAVSPTRSEFQRDRDRIIHSSAFRRLKHKTQVFVYHEGDHFRTRLTHTIEVSQIARALARSLGLDEDLAEALALSHDLGHTPFGHTGEDTLDECMAGFGGFDHNAQALRIVTRLERRYAAYDGLNLAWETLEGLVKHNGPLLDADGGPTLRYAARGVPLAILEYNAQHDLELSTYAGGEAQAAAIADDIAYDAHDIDDGLRAGLFTIEDLRQVPFLDGLLSEIEGLYPGLELSRRIHELTRRVITRFVEDVVAEGDRRLAALSPGKSRGHPAGGQHGGLLLEAHDGGGCLHQALPLCPDVPASGRDEGAGPGRRCAAGPLPALQGRAGTHAGGVADRSAEGRRATPRPPGGGLHRRHDGSIRDP
jgi:dGTPase